MLISIGANYLGPLADNGGPTLTHGLLPGRLAINAGDLTAVAGVDGLPVYDQRSEPYGRVFNGRIDIGAFVVQPDPLPGDYNDDTAVNAADFVVWRKFFNTTNSMADGDNSGDVDQQDGDIWQENFGLRNDEVAALGAFQATPLRATSESSFNNLQAATYVPLNVLAEQRLRPQSRALALEANARGTHAQTPRIDLLAQTSREFSGSIPELDFQRGNADSEGLQHREAIDAALTALCAEFVGTVP